MAVSLLGIHNVLVIAVTSGAGQPVAAVVVQLRDIRAGDARELVGHVVEGRLLVERADVREDATGGARDVDEGWI